MLDPTTPSTPQSRLKKSLSLRSQRPIYRRLLIPLILSPSLLLLFVSRHLLSDIEDQHHSNTFPNTLSISQLQSLNDSQLVLHLATNLHFWLSGPPSHTLIQIASVSDRRIAIQAILTPTNEITQKSNIPKGIVDIGAANGQPLSWFLFGNQSIVPINWLLSIEPHPSLFQIMIKQIKEKIQNTSLTFWPIQIAIGDNKGKEEMNLDKNNPTFSCISCNNKQVDEKIQVDINILDDLILEQGKKELNFSFEQGKEETKILLLHCNTHGHDTYVFQGAKKLFENQLIEYVLVPFDLSLFPGKIEAVDMIMTAISGGMRCIQLGYINKQPTNINLKEEDLPKSFGKEISNRDTAQEFFDHVHTANFPTELMCVKRS